MTPERLAGAALASALAAFVAWHVASPSPAAVAERAGAAARAYIACTEAHFRASGGLSTRREEVAACTR